MTQQAEHELDELTDRIPIPNVVTFEDWNTLKQYGQISKGFDKFAKEELDDVCVYYDSEMQFIDYLERREVEEITPAFVLLPRFFWEHHLDTLPLDYIPHMKVQDRIKILNHIESGYWTNLQGRASVGLDLLKCKATPREEQKPALDFFIDKMQTEHKFRGILQAAPGVGKTAMSIILAARLRAKTLIVVPNEVLQDQWMEAILGFTDLTEEDIGIIQGSDIQKIDKDIFSSEHDKVIYIVKIQSLYSQIKRNDIRHLQNLYRYIDMVVYDEVHGTGGATNYSKTTSVFFTPNILGLTATPYRTKINEYMLKVAIGGVAFRIEHDNLTPDIEIHSVYVEFSEGEKNRLRTIGQDYIMYLGMFGSMMKTKNQYFEYLADVVAWNHSQGHNIVVLFPTIALMENLRDQIEIRHPELHEHLLLLKGKTKADSLDLVKIERKKLMSEYKAFKERQDELVKAKTIKRKDANLAIKARRAEIDKEIDYLKENALSLYKSKVKDAGIIISNYNLLSAGFDKSNMSNIIFGGPPRVGKISVIQSIGRVTRIHEGKKQPLVQYFIPRYFLESHKSTGIILSKNIKVQYADAKFKYIGFDFFEKSIKDVEV